MWDVPDTVRPQPSPATKATMTTSSITLPIRDLHNAVKNVLHIASKTLPKNATHLPLDGAHLVTRRGVLVLEATDTAKMIQVNISFDPSTTIGNLKNGDAEEQSFGIISASSLKDLELWLRDSAKIKTEPYPMAELTCDEDSLTIQNVANEETMQCDTVTDQRYPDIDRLLTAYDFEQAPEKVMRIYDTAHFKTLTAVTDTRATRRKQSLSLTHDPKRKAIAVHWIAEGRVWAQGLLMPLIDPGIEVSTTVQF